jgi:S-adenosylmethionine decarboxylase
MNHHDMTQTASDYFITRNGDTYAGNHIIIDLWGAQGLDDMTLMEATIRQVVIDINATLIHLHLHHFEPNGGISGVAVLAESHLSVHSWPEKGFAAFDVFSCGDSTPEKAVAILTKAFCAQSSKVTTLKRGLI